MDHIIIFAMLRMLNMSGQKFLFFFAFFAVFSPASRTSYFYPLEEGMATHSSILAWKTPQTEEPGGLHIIGLQRVGHD